MYVQVIAEEYSTPDLQSDHNLVPVERQDASVRHSTGNHWPHTRHSHEFFSIFSLDLKILINYQQTEAHMRWDIKCILARKGGKT